MVIGATQSVPNIHNRYSVKRHSVHGLSILNRSGEVIDYAVRHGDNTISIEGNVPKYIESKVLRMAERALPKF